jgi:large subunit ribosomal protein L28
MTRKCDITGKTVLTGHNVSHSNIKTKRRFLPNLNTLSFHSETLGCKISLRLTANGLRTIEHNFGIDHYLLNTPSSKLSSKALKVKRLMQKTLKQKKLTFEQSE